MSRDDGFAIADVDAAYLGDQKLKNLWRALGDEGRMARAVLLHMATLLESWRSGSRATVAESVPLWLHPDPELVAALQKAHLLDAAGRVPIRSWKAWHDPAAARRQVLRDRWNRANAKRVKGDSAVTARSPRGSSAVTATPVPSGQDSTVRPVRAMRAAAPAAAPAPAPALAREETWFDGKTSDQVGDVQQWLAKERSVSVPDGGGLIELSRLVDQHGAPAVIEALGKQDPAMKDGRQYVFGAMKTLNPLPSTPRAPAETPEMRQVREMRERAEARRRARETGAST